MAKRTKIITTVPELQAYVTKATSNGKTVGFTPTMGALHNGHMVLINHSIKENDITICSIFVNPTQFNEKSDLDKYPRTIEADMKLLRKNNADVAFIPSVKAVYPKGKNKSVKVDLEGLDDEMEGAFRPGHFAGVVQVVHRLVDIVKPNNLYMGQKDFQQFTIIAKMLSNLDMSTKLRVVPIVRGKDGLALSSRNVRLTKKHRVAAPLIHKTLKAVNRKKYQLTVKQLEKYAMERLAKADGFKPEYFMLADGYTLKPIKNIKKTDYVVACTAVWAGDVRLIDNMIYKKPRSLKIFTPSL